VAHGILSSTSSFVRINRTIWRFETFVNVLGISTDACGDGGIYREGTHMARDAGRKREEQEEERAEGPGDCLARPFEYAPHASPCVLKMEPGAWGRATAIDGTIMQQSNWSDSES
jgi:hypothetical protein